MEKPLKGALSFDIQWHDHKSKQTKKGFLTTIHSSHTITNGSLGERHLTPLKYWYVFKSSLKIVKITYSIFDKDYWHYPCIDHEITPWSVQKERWPNGYCAGLQIYLVVLVWALARVHCVPLCSWARHFALMHITSLHQLVNLTLGGPLL